MTARKEWSREETFSLISIYKKNSMLWNLKDSEYRNRDRKNKTIHEIAVKFRCSSEEIQRKLHNLRNQMSQELRKMIKKKDRNGSAETDVSNWPYFSALKFLIPVVCTNMTQSSLVQASASILERTEAEKYAVDKDAESEEEEKRILPTQKKRKNEDDNIRDQLFKFAFETIVKQPDDYDKFGQYVALELKALKSDFNKARLKSEIRKIIARVADEDLYGTTSNTSSSISDAEMIMKASIHSEAELLSPPMPKND
ncbi:uncharacterized protein LOC114876321 [Osmia bicornis bicornis]|uniref:uncharacterized protein LOC114876321 n=1 Tax=Osmia bicornis bicornis TaxID=1437191 RepID=UPI0010F780EF|nr:uncharacterized protein LOC114876321 [Osmia bicornis bicornis]XP_029043491.1 uncharacterized protein LOC114876321 [Osmia bicornis bicornis]